MPALDQVWRGSTREGMATKTLKWVRPPSRIRRRKESTGFTSLRFGDTRRCRRGDELGGFQHGGAERRRNHPPERDQDAGSGNRREGDFDVALPGKVFDDG